MILYLALTFVLGIVCAWGLIIVVPIVFASERLANLYSNAAMKIGKRTSLVVTRSGELKWRRMKDTDTGSQKVGINGNTITLSDPDRSILPFHGKPFCLSDAVYGVIFTPIHAACGGAKARLESKNNFTVGATKEQKQDKRIHGWIQDRVFIPFGKCPDLRDVRSLATGRERGTDPSKAWEFFKYIKMDKQTGMAFLKMLAPVGIYVVLTVLFWQMLSSGGGSSGSGNPAPSPGDGNGTTISVVLFSLSAIPHRKKITAILIVCALIVLGAYVAPYTTIFAMLFAIMWLVGVAIGLGIFGLFGLALGGMGFGGATSGLLFSSALWLLESPTLVQDKREYFLIDRSVEGPTFKYGRHGIQFAFTESAIENFDGYLCTTSQYDMPDTAIKNENQERGSVRTVEGLADEPDEFGHYVSMASTLGSLATGFIGQETDQKVQEAKEEFGDGVTGMSMKMTLLASMGSIVLAILTAVIFFA